MWWTFVFMISLPSALAPITTAGSGLSIEMSRKEGKERQDVQNQ